MPKRYFCAVWMAVAASLVMPLFLFEPVLLLVTLAAGAIPGALLQPLAVGRDSNGRRAALAGMFCAGLAVPLGGFLVFVFDDPQGFVRDPIRAIGTLLQLSGLVLMFLFWWILPLGACAGALLQVAWERREREGEERDEEQGGDAG